MVYKLFRIEFHTLAELSDLRKPIEVLNIFVDCVGANRIRGFNFNKYYQPESGEIHPRIDIRMDFIPEEEEAAWTEICRTSQQLLASNDIRWWSATLEDWNEPPLVIKAHETATKCAIAFKEQFDTNNQPYEELTRKPDDFMWLFAVSLLRTAGFRPYIAWTYLRNEIPAEIGNMAISCSPTLTNVIGNRRPHPDFLERFLHAFFNCTKSSEQKLVNVLIGSDAYQKLSDSWQSAE